MAGKHLEFVWEIEKGKKITCPIQIEKISSNNSHTEGKLINPENQEFLSQIYIDKTTGKIFEYKDRTHRRYIDKDRKIDIIYTKAERDAFMKNKVDDILIVDREIDISYLPEIFPLFRDRPFEVYSVDEKRKGINQMIFLYKYLHLKKKFLLVKFGFNGEYRAGIIVATNRQIVLQELTDGRQIKGSNMLGLPIQQREDIQELIDYIIEFSKRNTIDLWQQFVDAVSTGKKIEVVEKKEVEKVEDTLDWQEELLKSLEKEKSKGK